MLGSRPLIGLWLAIVLFCGLSGAAAARPEGNALSEFVYPPPQGALRFSHAAHAKIDCLRCHAGISESSRSAERNLPSEAACAECHAKAVRKRPDERGTPERCGLCHSDFKGDDMARPKRPSYPSPVLNFSHTAHVLRMQACTSCHKGMALAESGGGPPLPQGSAVSRLPRPARTHDRLCLLPSQPALREAGKCAERAQAGAGCGHARSSPRLDAPPRQGSGAAKPGLQKLPRR